MIYMNKAYEVIGYRDSGLADKLHVFIIFKIVISSPNSMFDHLLESFHRSGAGQIT